MCSSLAWEERSSRERLRKDGVSPPSQSGQAHKDVHYCLIKLRQESARTVLPWGRMARNRHLPPLLLVAYLAQVYFDGHWIVSGYSLTRGRTVPSDDVSLRKLANDRIKEISGRDDP